jgi:hypothetical protein
MSNYVYFRVPSGVIHKNFIKQANNHNVTFKVLHNVGDAFIIKTFLPQENADVLASLTNCTYRTQEEVDISIKTRAINNNYDLGEL